MKIEECDIYIFEICSMKTYTDITKMYQTNYVDKNCVVHSQNAEDLYNDLHIIRGLFPPDKIVIFQTHFRLNLIYNDESQSIDARNTIYETVKKFTENSKNTFICDPNEIIITLDYLKDSNHWSDIGIIACFNYYKEKFFNNNYQSSV